MSNRRASPRSMRGRPPRLQDILVKVHSEMQAKRSRVSLNLPGLTKRGASWAAPGVGVGSQRFRGSIWGRAGAQWRCQRVARAGDVRAVPRRSAWASEKVLSSVAIHSAKACAGPSRLQSPRCGRFQAEVGEPLPPNSPGIRVCWPGGSNFCRVSLYREHADTQVAPYPLQPLRT